jgi:hypothetical protein
MFEAPKVTSNSPSQERKSLKESLMSDVARTDTLVPPRTRVRQNHFKPFND